MIPISFDTRNFKNEMDNILDYSIGFLDGVRAGKKKFLENLGVRVVEVLRDFIDSNARINPEMLQHMYEWDRTGSPSARLYDIDYTVSNLGLSLKSTFRQSSSIKAGSTVPFYNKAYIMENGMPVTIAPKRAKVLVFEDDGETVFTKGPVTINSPGGEQAAGSFQATFDSFFKNYFTQAFIMHSGLSEYIKNPISYKKNLLSGSRLGRAKGIDVGYRWIANAGLVS